MRRTKVIATLGPATNSRLLISEIIAAGVNVVRLNFSHGTIQEHQQRAQWVRECAAKADKVVAILGDLQGPKIRIAKFVEAKVLLIVGQSFILDTQYDAEAGNSQIVGIDYKALVRDCSCGDVLLLDDGRVVLNIDKISGQQLICTVVVGGVLSDNKGINRQGGGLSAQALTDKDKRDIKSAAQIGVDYIAVSFPRNAEDMRYARKLLDEAGCDAGIIAKIERAEAVVPATLDGIIEVSDGVMVARGDLGVEIGDAELMAVQKHIIKRARQLNTLVITATQMMESMIHSPLPTRAEVFDVANAVLDGTDAVMLSAETAAGEYPVAAVAATVRVILGAENHPQTKLSKHRINQAFDDIDEVIGLAAMYAANHLSGVKAIVCMTATGGTPLLMSRISSGLPIFALTPKQSTQQRMALMRGVQPISFDLSTLPPPAINQAAVDCLLTAGAVADGDVVIITKGDYVNVNGGTNTLKIVRVGAKIQ
ncbi:MAG: pyruvate kinase [Osedax symbiont Rs1]|nr:MAG: pyruvate kinase [Osedax symbiont Rs1]